MKNINPEQTSFYFIPELSFYSLHHGGTFHFFQLNVLHADEFIKSIEFKHLVDFLKAVYKDDEKVNMSNESLQDFFKSLGHHRDIIEISEEERFQFA